jgi:hypothetical protein
MNTLSVADTATSGMVIGRISAHFFGPIGLQPSYLLRKQLLK